MKPVGHGKIARLPRGLQEQLNRRLQDGERYAPLAAWLNGLAEVRAVLDAEFGGRPIRAQNLSEWRKRGFREWCAQQEALDAVRQLFSDGGELAAVETGALADQLALCLMARLAVELKRTVNISDTPGTAWSRMRELVNAFVALRRGDQNAERLRLERERFEESLREQRAAAAEAERRATHPGGISEETLKRIERELRLL